ncbi:MAG TPA: hypothetical protein PK029_00205 [Bacteroidales bacterium]|nr:hypothetical protein [Bacteroidales bacterium]
MDFTYTLAIIGLPFVTFLLLGLLHNKLSHKLAGIIGSSSLFISFTLSCITAYFYFFKYGKVDGAYQKIEAFNITWLQLTDQLHIDMGILLDPISVMMLMVVTTVSLMVHIYSTGYMHGDNGFNRFFSFLSLL